MFLLSILSIQCQIRRIDWSTIDLLVTTALNEETPQGNKLKASFPDELPFTVLF